MSPKTLASTRIWWFWFTSWWIWTFIYVNIVHTFETIKHSLAAQSTTRILQTTNNDDFNFMKWFYNVIVVSCKIHIMAWMWFICASFIPKKNLNLVLPPSLLLPFWYREREMWNAQVVVVVVVIIRGDLSNPMPPYTCIYSLTLLNVNPNGNSESLVKGQLHLYMYSFIHHVSLPLFISRWKCNATIKKLSLALSLSLHL